MIVEYTTTVSSFSYKYIKVPKKKKFGQAPYTKFLE